MQLISPISKHWGTRPLMDWPPLTALLKNLSIQESCAVAKMTAQCALYMDALKIFRTLCPRPRLLFSTFSWAFVPIDLMNVPTKFEVRSFTRSWDNRGYPKKLDSPWIRPRSLFSQILMGFYFDWPCKCIRQIWSLSFYRLSIVTFPLSLRVPEILPLFISSMPLFPYPL